MMAFKSKKVLVLGGSRGIGAAIVRRFVADGASVTFTYSGSPDAAHALAAETGATAEKTDSADREAVIARLDALRAEIGRLPGPTTLDDLRADRARDDMA